MKKKNLIAWINKHKFKPDDWIPECVDVEEFKKKKIEFISLTEGFDTSTAQGQLFFNIIGSFAQFERSLIKERIDAGLDRAKKEGKQLGRPKGSKDKKVRRKSGYYTRWTK